MLIIFKMKKIIKAIKKYGKSKGLTEDLILIKWFCKNCGLSHYINLKEDKITTKMICPHCFSEMHRVKEEYYDI